MDNEDANQEVRQVGTLRPGKVAIYACERESSVVQALKSHETCIAEFEQHFILASHDMDQLPVVPEACIAEFTLGEAHSISSELRSGCFVFVTKAVDSRADYGFMVKLGDWRKILNRRSAEASEGPQAVPLEREYFAAVLIDLRQRFDFKAVAVNADAVGNWVGTLFNVGHWLQNVWSISGAWIKSPELELRALKCDQEFVEHTNHVFNLGKEFKVPLLICHLFKYWEATRQPYKQRGWELATILGEKESFSENKMHRLQASATCINPPPDTARESYGTLRSGIKRSYRPAGPSTHSLEPKSLCWLLAVRYPVEFAAQLKAGRSIADLTGSTGKKAQVEVQN
jgi:hypothetical protein